ncbi:MAG: lipopolysaccharide heptosyltransferase II [Sulfuricellaceae bacterium]
MSKALIIAPSWVGDAVMAQPLFRRLREHDPERVLDAFAPSWVAPVLERMAEINRVVINPFAHGELRLKVRWNMGRSLRRDAYRHAIVLPNSLKSALLPFFAGIPLRTGYIGEMRHLLLNDARRLDKLALPLMVERFAALAERPGAPLQRPVPFPRLSVDVAQQCATLDKLGLAADKPVAAFCIGAEYGAAKRWPARHFARLAQLLAADYEIWLLGSQKDAAIGAEIVALSHGAARNLCGATDLGEAVDLIATSALVVSNDSGLMHVAAALDKPMAALYGSSSPGFTPPLSDKARVLTLNLPCSPCFKRTCPLGHLDCLEKLTPEQVEAGIGV